jgi:thiosulfate reductase cytochrome b subunit
MSLTALLYLAAGLVSGHLWRDIVPRLRDFAPGSVWRDIRAHLRLPLPRAPGGPPYGNLQRLSYAGVVLVALPLMIASGLTMSPAVTSAYPGLLDFFGGSQSARTIHFLTFAALVLFVVVHVLMVMMTGFRRQIRAMTIGD